jgi:hypothetical protein
MLTIHDDDDVRFVLDQRASWIFMMHILTETKVSE